MMAKNALFVICLLICLTACGESSQAEKMVALATDDILSADLSKHYALLGHVEGQAQLWRLQPKALLYSWRHNAKRKAIIKTAISANEDYAITAEKNSMAWWRISDGILLKGWSLPDISSLNISADGRFALVGLQNKAIYFDLKQGQTQYVFPHQDAVVTSDLSLHGQYALTGSRDRTAKLWDLTNGELKYTWQHSNPLATVTLSDDDRYAMTNAALNQISLWNISDGQLYREIGYKRMTLSAARFSANDEYLIIGQISRRIDLWNIKIGENIQSWHPANSTILALAFTDDEKKIYSINTKGFLQRWRK